MGGTQRCHWFVHSFAYVSTDHDLGALGDSFYEYLIKSWLATGKRDVQAKRMYDETIEVRLGAPVVYRSD